MKRIIYSVGFFLIVLFLCTGFMLSYQVADLKDRIYDLEESSAQVQQQVSAVSANPKGQFQQILKDRILFFSAMRRES